MITTLLELTTGNRWRKIVTGHAVVLDDSFTEAVLKPRRWHRDDYGYPRYSPSYATPIRLHNLIYDHYHGPAPKGYVIDHIDRNVLNATPSNLRAVEKCVNNANRDSGHGVYFDIRRKHWIARVTVRGTRRYKYISSCESKEEAQRLVNAALIESYPELKCE